MTTPEAEYRRRHAAFLEVIAANLTCYLADCLKGTPHLDRVTARAKAPDRFAEKAARVDEHGVFKYAHPLSEIQDILGGRVVVFYKGDVATVTAVIRRYFQAIEQKALVPDSDWEFGYFGQHLILPLPGDVVPVQVPTDEVPRFFELQIKTLFQHAWSEANHDLGYKAERNLEKDHQRRLAYTAAQAWGADRVFDELYQELTSSG